MAYCNYHIHHNTGLVKKGQNSKMFKNIETYHEKKNLFNSGYNFCLVNNKNEDKSFIMNHCNSDFHNGLIIAPTKKNKLGDL